MNSPEPNFPNLPERYGRALRLAVDYIFVHFQPFGVIVTGSIVRGNPDASSDLDLVVLHEHPWRQRVQKWFDGIPAEIFVNSPAWMRRYFHRGEADRGRPTMAHMVATGHLVFSASETTFDLIREARAVLDGGPDFSLEALERRRYHAATLLEDALDLAHRDEAAAMLMLGCALQAAAEYWFSSQRRFTARSKELLEIIRGEAPETGALFDQALLAPEFAARVMAARELARTVIGAEGFFEWSTGVDESEP